MIPKLQPVLENENVRLEPLKSTDFERLYAVARDPKIWEQHPNRDRYKKDVFQTFFDGAMQSGSAFLITDKASGEVAGTSRYYDFDEAGRSIFVGYTFYGTKFWGSKINPQVKKLMLDYIFKDVDFVRFHVGKENFRSRKAVERLGAELVQEISVAYHGEPSRDNVEYKLTKENWKAKNSM